MSAAGDAILKLLLVGEDKSASAALGKVAAKAKETGEKAKASLGGIGGGLGAIGGIAAAAGIVKFGKDAVDSFTNVGTESIKLSRLTGLPIEQASRLRFAFQQTGVDADAAGKGIQTFSKNLMSGKADKAVAALGLSMKDSSGHIKTMDQLLPGIADKFKGMPDGPEKTAIAMSLFGKSGASMIPFLNKGAEGIKSLEDASDKYGLTISGPMADQIKKAKASQRDWDATVQGLSVTFGATLLPVLTQVMAFIRDSVVPIIQNTTGFLSRHGEVVGNVAAVLGLVAAPIAAIIMGMKAWAVVQGMLNIVMSANPIALIIIGIAALAAGLIYAYQHSETFRQIVDTAFKAIGQAATWLWNNALQPMVKMFVEGLSGIIWWLGNLLTTLGKVPGFEWAADAGRKMKDAANDVYAFSKSIEKIPEKKDVALNVTANYSAGVQAVLGNSRASVKLAKYDVGGRPVPGELAMFHANELWIPDTPGTVITANNTAALLRGGGGPSGLSMGGSGGGGVVNNYFTIQGDSDPIWAAKQIERKLVELKTFRGGTLAFQGA